MPGAGKQVSARCSVACGPFLAHSLTGLLAGWLTDGLTYPLTVVRAQRGLLHEDTLALINNLGALLYDQV